VTDDAASSAPRESVVEPVEPVEQTAYGVPVTWSRGQRVLHPSRDDYRRVAEALHADCYLMCVDVTAVDYLAYDGRADLPAGVVPERFEVVASFLNHRDRARARVRVQVPASDPVIPSLWELHPGTEAPEREVFDMFGIGFEGHPDLTRILMPEDWSGHPLRKDWSSGRIPVQFKAGEGRGAAPAAARDQGM
jgi:NADH-quinone oxidoreductase subunit C